MLCIIPGGFYVFHSGRRQSSADVLTVTGMDTRTLVAGPRPRPRDLPPTLPRPQEAYQVDYEPVDYEINRSTAVPVSYRTCLYFAALARGSPE